METKFFIHSGDITTCKVDAIVNAANEGLMPGGGVCGAIYKAAGNQLYFETLTLGPCPTGEVRVSKAYKLPAKFVIHAVGPIYLEGKDGEDLLLTDCYRNTLEAAHKAQAKTIAFPAISTGIYNYPIREATEIALKTCSDYVKEYPDAFTEIYFICFKDEDLIVYDEIAHSLDMNIPVGVCKECLADVRKEDKMPDRELYECPECFHPHRLDELY